MSHQAAGHYALKHPKHPLSPKIVAALKNRAKENHISCAEVHVIAKSFNVSPSVVGVQADLIELRLTRCILGLFGYGQGKKEKGKNLDPHVTPSPELQELILRRAHDKRLSCLECWEIARDLKLKRVHVSSACEKMGIKITPCQLGAF